MKYLDTGKVQTRRMVVRNCPVEIIERLKFYAARSHETFDLATVRALLIGLTELEGGRQADVPAKER